MTGKKNNKPLPEIGEVDEEAVDDLDEAQEVIPFTYSITSYGANYPAQPNSDDINYLFSALDKGRNTDPVGRLGRQELHDRMVLHRYS